METRRMIITLVACFAFFSAYQYFYSTFFPAPPYSSGETAQTPSTTLPAPPAGETAAPATQPAAAAYRFDSALAERTVTLGGRDGDKLRAELSSRGAALVQLQLTEKKKNGEYAHRANATGNQPFSILSPVRTDRRTVASYLTRGLNVTELGTDWRPLDDLLWQVAEETPDSATFATALRAEGSDAETLLITKTYRLSPDTTLVELTFGFHNTSDRTLSVSLMQDGPVGIPGEASQGNPRFLFAAYRDSEGTFRPEQVQRDAAAKTGEAPLPAPDEKSVFLWTALTDRYFGVFTRPLADAPNQAPGIQSIKAVVTAPESATDVSDLAARWATLPITVPPDGKARLRYEICAAPKDPDVLARINPALVDPAQLNFVAVRAADRSCCTFEPLPSIMTWLLETIHMIVRNYGLAIIGIVIIVRSLLHPLAVFQQKAMYRMQEAMGRIQPKVEAVKEKYANDRARLQQEMMKVYAEENVNPMASMVGMLPLFIQLPILVALWTALSTDVHLRNAPFDGWWIKDLSSPDALIRFAHPITVPILGWLPLIGRMFTDIPAINLLPILMGVSMYLQQKYMPKPASVQARLDAAKKAPPAQRKPGGGMTPEEQLRQQQMIGNMMAVIFPLMFYYMPSGLSLYMMATSIFGMIESLIIRRQLEREKDERAKRGPQPPKKPGFMAKLFKRLVEQAAEIQEKADQISTQQPRRK